MTIAMLRHPLQFAREHRLTRAQASAFLDDELRAEQRARIEHHTHLCAPCARLLTSLRQTVSALRSLGRVDAEPADGRTDDILRRVREEG